jgi:Trypsin-co-occurring domain 1
MNSNKKIVPFPIEPGSAEVIWVEVDGDGQSQTELEIPAGMGALLENLPAVSFDGALKQIKPATRAIMQTLTDLNNPEEISVEFGIKLNAKAGALFTSLDGEANFKVTVKWKNPISPPGEKPPLLAAEKDGVRG